MAGRDNFMARGERLTRLVWERLGLAAAERPHSSETYGGSAMDRPLTPPPAWRRYAPYAAGLVLLSGVGTWLLWGQGGDVYRVPADQLTIATVNQGPFEDFAAVQGAVAPFITDYLTTAQGGTVQKLLVEDGAMVKAGQPLIELSNPALALQEASQEVDTSRQMGDLQNTELQLEQTNLQYQKDVLDIEYQVQKLKDQLARDKILSDGGAIAQAVYQQDQDQYAYELKLNGATIASHTAEQKLRDQQLSQLRITLARLNANLTAARAGLDALTIRAPMDGQLNALDAEKGQSKAPGTVLGQVASRDRFKLTAQVDEFYLSRTAAGQEALMTIDGKDYSARVAKVYPQVASGTFKIDLNFSGAAPLGIHNGQAVDIKLELGGGTTNAVMLPNGSFYQDTGGNWVFVLAPDGRSAIRRNVRLGRRNPQYVEVLDGLKPGERVIVSSYTAFEKMDRVEFEQPSGSST